jgi:hypothetical protein
MLKYVWFEIKFVTNKSDEDIKKYREQINHVMRSNLQDIIIEEVEWQQTEDVLPLQEDVFE